MGKTFIIIPAWNEQKTIGQVIDEVRKYYENIIVVDDGSKDRTAEIAKQHGAFIISHDLNRGQGAALETGNQYARKNNADMVVHFDADGQFLASEIKDFEKEIEDGNVDVVFGSRFLGKESKIPFSKRYFLLPIARIVNRIFFGIKLTDPQCGFRALNKKALDKIIIENDGMAHCNEIIIKTFQNNLEYKEIPITVLYKEFGQNLAGGVKLLKDILLNKFLK